MSTCQKCIALILDPAQALDLTSRLAAGAALVGNWEMFAARRTFSTAGVFHLDGVQGLHWKPSRLLRILGGREMAVLGIGAAGCLALLLAGPWGATGVVGLILALSARLAMAQRRIIGGDGAEQLTTLTLVVVLLAAAPVSSPQRIQFAVAFIGGQVILAYLTSGVSKLASPLWRNGSAMTGIIHTQTYGLRAVALALDRIPRGSLILGWAVMLFESAFVLLLFGPHWLVIAVLACAFIFHLGCAVVMGLNDFLLAFPATFPCVLMVAQWLSGAVSSGGSI